MMHHKILLLTLLQSVSSSNIFYLHAQVPDTQWVGTYGGIGEDRCFDVHHTSDGGYVLAGYTHSFSAQYYDVYVAKIDSIGTMQWHQIIGGDDYDEGYAVDQTYDNGYIITGYTESYGYGSRNVYLIRLNPDGDTLWTKTYTLQGYDDRGWDVHQTTDGGYIIGVSTVSEMILMKTDSLGVVEWTVERQRSLKKMRVKVVETFGVVLEQKRGTNEYSKEATWRAQHRPKAL